MNAKEAVVNNKSYDAIIIPGGGVRAGGELPIWTQTRLERAMQIDACRYVILLSAGTTHRPPPLDGRGYPIFESIAAADYMLRRGFPAAKILTETSSYDTIGNAYFSRVIHVDALRLQNLLVITSGFHLPRSRAIFNWVYGLEKRAVDYRLDFEGLPDDGMDLPTLEARKKREQQSLRNVEGLAARIHTLEKFHIWLYSEHDAYRMGGTNETSQAKDALESY